ncbi:MAG: hypothetical protein O3B41_02095 [Bacteroidetes bacterium]|nr:hypothetical protein [Bacteroidota bacterium]
MKSNKESSTAYAIDALEAYISRHRGSPRSSLITSYTEVDLDFMEEVGTPFLTALAERYKKFGLAELRAEYDTLVEIMKERFAPEREWQWEGEYLNALLYHITVLIAGVAEPNKSIHEFLEKGIGKPGFPFCLVRHRDGWLLELSTDGARSSRPKIDMSVAEETFDSPGVHFNLSMSLVDVKKMVDMRINHNTWNMPELHVFEEVEMLDFRLFVLKDALEFAADWGGIPVRGIEGNTQSETLPKNLFKRRMAWMCEVLLDTQHRPPGIRPELPDCDETLFHLIDAKATKSRQASMTANGYAQFFRRVFNERPDEKKPKKPLAWAEYCLENYDKFMT